MTTASSIHCHHGSLRTCEIIRKLLLAPILLASPLAHATLPLLPPGDNTENIVFQDDFSYGNLKGWSNIAAGTGSSTIANDPNGSGASVWYPSVNSDGSGPFSEVVLPADVNIANGPICVYMRVRFDSASGGWNNGFQINLTEKAPTWKYASVQIQPGVTTYLVSHTAAGTQLFSNMGANIAPAPGVFADFRMRLDNNGNGSMTVQLYRYDIATSAYVSVGTSVTTADTDTGIFNRLSIQSMNQTVPASAARAYCDSVMVTQVGSPRASVPSNAYRLPFPLPVGVTIQSALDTYGTVVLSQGDYSGGPAGAPAITLRSDQKLYGDPAGSGIPDVIVAPGARGAVLSNLKVGYWGDNNVTFPASTLETSGNVFERLSCKIVANGATLKDNLFLSTAGTITADTSAGGYLRNNRFIRSMTHGTPNQLTLLGDAARSSYGNVFVWKNFLTPIGDTITINNQKDLTFVGVDAESWNFRAYGTSGALWKVGPMGTLRIFGMNGGNHRYSPTGDGLGADYLPGTPDDNLPFDNRTSDFDIDADEFQLYNDAMEQSGTSVVSPFAPIIDYKLGVHNVRSLLVNSSTPGKLWSSAATAPFRIKAFDSSMTNVSTSTSGTPTPSWKTYTTALPTRQQTTLRSMVVTPTRPAGQIEWEAPKYDVIPDPAGPNWATNLAAQPDSTAYIQGLINANGVARLPAGIYYISQPLKLSHTQGIVGAGAETTAIIAKTSAIDMVVMNDPVTADFVTIITLADLTLQGGQNGIHFDPVGTSSNLTAPFRRASYTGCSINHVTFRNMSTAGIFMDRIYALDNNFFSYLRFVNCDTGLKQFTDPNYIGGDDPNDPYAPRMMFMDKCMFYKCQFVGNRLALDLPAHRGSSLNAWVNCLFQNNTQGAAAMNNYLTAVFANSDFINNGGTAVLQNNVSTSFVSCGFVAGANGVAMFGGDVSAEGCSFDRTGSTTAKILSGNNNSIFLNNCSSVNMPIGIPSGTAANGMLINTTLGVDPTLNKQMVSIKSGSIYTILPGTPAPAPQLLIGSDWSTSLTPTKDY